MVPFLIAALVVEALLLILALLVAVFGVLVRPVRWLARGLAVVGLLVGLALGFGAVVEWWQTDYPLVRPGAPFGSYTQPTNLMLLEMVVGALVLAAEALLAFRHPRPAGLLFVAAGTLNLLGSLRQYQDPTIPPDNATFGLVAIALPSLVVGAVLLATWWADHRTGPRDQRRAIWWGYSSPK
jgi:hypothetical protein